MAINSGQLHSEATDKVPAALPQPYNDTKFDPDAMSSVAEPVADISVATVEQFIAGAGIRLSGEGIH